MTRNKRACGFTLVEMIMVMVITGIIAGMVAVFIVPPVQGYFASVRRAVLTEEADGALRFLARDVKAALPNSIACSGGGLQFLAVRSGGRYREQQTGTNTGTPLVFDKSITGFDIIGSGADSTTKDAYGNSVSGLPSSVVIGNLSSGVSTCHSDASAFAGNSGTLSGLGAGSVTISSTTYPVACDLASPSVQDNSSTTSINESNDREFGRFYVVNAIPVTYVCDAASGLTRNDSTPSNPIPIVAPSHVSACQVACDNTKARVQLVTVNLTLKNKDNERVNMLRRVTIVNRP